LTAVTSANRLTNPTQRAVILRVMGATDCRVIDVSVDMLASAPGAPQQLRKRSEPISSGIASDKITS